MEYRDYIWWANITSAVFMCIGLIGTTILLMNVDAIETFTLAPPYGDNMRVLRPVMASDSVGIHPAAIIAAYFGITAVEHVVNIFRADQLNAAIIDKYVWTRWLSYSVTAPIMMVTLGAISGVIDAYTLVLIGFLTFLCILCGWADDYVRDNSTIGDRTIGRVFNILGFLALIFAHVPIWGSYNTYSSVAPAFVTGLVAVMTLLMFSFGFVRVVFRDRPYPQELAFYFLSLTSKQILGWVIATGIAARTD
jgi:hypothetical protein